MYKYECIFEELNRLKDELLNVLNNDINDSSASPQSKELAKDLIHCLPKNFTRIEETTSHTLDILLLK